MRLPLNPPLGGTQSEVDRVRAGEHTSNVLDSNLLEVTKEGVAEAAALLGCVADPIRLGLVTTLAKRGKTCVCTMQEEAEVPANLLSYHLKVLREAGLVTATRRGRWMDYELATDALDRLHAALPVSDLASVR